MTIIIGEGQILVRREEKNCERRGKKARGETRAGKNEGRKMDSREKGLRGAKVIQEEET